MSAGGDRSVLSRSFHTSKSAEGGAKRKDYLCPTFIVFQKRNDDDLERLPKMKQNCRDCIYFEFKGIMPGSTNWGLCIKFAKKIMGSDKESPFFRWEDDTCSNFKAKKKLGDLHTRTTKT